MSTRITHNTRQIPALRATGGGALRVTQVSRQIAYDLGTLRTGGAARVTQLSRQVVAMMPIPGGGLMMKGMGS